MTLGNIREQGRRHLIAYYLNDACRHQALIDVLIFYPDNMEVPSLQSKVKCAKCGRKGRWIRRNWREARGVPDSWRRGDGGININLNF